MTVLNGALSATDKVIDLGARLYVKVNPGDTNWQEVALV